MCCALVRHAQAGRFSLLYGCLRCPCGGWERCTCAAGDPSRHCRVSAALEDIAAQAHARWRLNATLIIHRFGELRPTDQIVMVGVTSAHRGDAFSACEFIMDFLKTRAPFWKKEQTPQGARWVDARSTDDDAAARWGAAPDPLGSQPSDGQRTR